MNPPDPFENWEQMNATDRRIFLTKMGLDLSKVSNAEISTLPRSYAARAWKIFHSIREATARVNRNFDKPRSVGEHLKGTNKLLDAMLGKPKGPNKGGNNRPRKPRRLKKP